MTPRTAVSTTLDAISTLIAHTVLAVVETADRGMCRWAELTGDDDDSVSRHG